MTGTLHSGYQNNMLPNQDPNNGNIDMITKKGGISREAHLLDKDRQPMTAQRRRISLPQG